MKNKQHVFQMLPNEVNNAFYYKLANTIRELYVNSTQMTRVIDSQQGQIDKLAQSNQDFRHQMEKIDDRIKPLVYASQISPYYEDLIAW